MSSFAPKTFLPFVVASISLAACAVSTGSSEPTTESSAQAAAADTIAPHALRVIGGTTNAPPAGARSTPIDNHGGSVMSGTTDTFVIWYGTWSAADKSIITDFLSNVGGSQYYRINTTYGDSSGGRVAPSVRFAGSVDDAYSRGKALQDSDIQAIVQNKLDSGTLPRESNALYFVLTATDVSEGAFCSSFCGWHTHASLSSTDVKYSFVGNAVTACPSACGASASPSPNGSPGADAMVSVIAHELSETVSDPDLNAFYDASGAENGDKCAWNFGTTYTTSNGASANVKIGARDYKIQQMWANEQAGYCGLSLHTQSDYNFDGIPDVLWHDPTTGDLADWFLTGPEALTVGSDGYLGWNVKGTDWQAKGTADFNRDGVLDVLWHNVTTGDVAVWFMGGAQSLTITHDGYFPWNVKGSSGWELKGATDFNGDGIVDLLWHNPGTGEVGVWFLSGADGLTPTHTGTLTWNVKNSPWDIKGTGDFNRDGYNDVLWHNPTTGELSVWFMSGAEGTVVDHDKRLTWNVPGTTWQLRATADFNRDGKVDLLWHNPTSGQVGTWTMSGADGTTVDHNGFLNWNVPGTEWHIVGVGN